MQVYNALLLTKTFEGVHLFTLKYAIYFDAGIAQLVERCLAKAKVASSSLVSRSIFPLSPLQGYNESVNIMKSLRVI